MNLKAWQTYVLICIVVAHLSFAFVGMQLGKYKIPAFRPELWRPVTPMMQCALLAVFGAFSKFGYWKRFGLFLAGLVYVALVQAFWESPPPPSIHSPFDWASYLRPLEFFALKYGVMTVGTVIVWLPIRYWLYSTDRSQTGRARQFGLGHVLTVTFVFACIMAAYRINRSFGLVSVNNMFALGIAATFLSKRHRWIGIVIISLSLIGVTVFLRYRLCAASLEGETRALGGVALTLLLWKLARIPVRTERIDSGTRTIEQTVHSS